MPVLLVFQLIILLFSVMIHEISHGLMAFRLGDPTAKLAGRLTLNPLKHLDPVGSFLLPFLLYTLSGGSFMFGYAKPVPYNPNFLKDPKRGGGLIALAGPTSNILLALIFGMLSRILFAIHPAFLPEALVALLDLVVVMNLVLAVFNLVPIPPLDGSKVLFAFLPDTPSVWRAQAFLERYGMFFLIAFMFYGFGLIVPIISVLFRLITGTPLM